MDYCLDISSGPFGDGGSSVGVAAEADDCTCRGICGTTLFTYHVPIRSHNTGLQSNAFVVNLLTVDFY